jgi:hypothetical protein
MFLEKDRPPRSHEGTKRNLFIISTIFFAFSVPTGENLLFYDFINIHFMIYSNDRRSCWKKLKERSR